MTTKVGSFPCECSADVPDGHQHEASCPVYVNELDELRAEVADANAEVEQLQAVLEKILDSALSLDAYIPPYLVDAIKDALRDADNTD